MRRPPARLVSWLYLPLLLTLALNAISPARAQTHVQLILDASGSMFNKLADGRYRIVAAKEALAELIAGIPAADDLNVGLRVYGSRLRGTEPGACEDSQLFVPMDGLARQALLDTVQATQARGATPIAYSLQLAADDFAGLSGKKLIVLVTDGEEACGGDVRAAAEALKAAGVDIDLRIIGFDLTDRAISSFEGVGTFENATSAAELLAALNRAVEAATEPAAAAPLNYRVTVTLTRGGEAVLEGATVAFQPAIAAVSEAERFQPGANGQFGADLPAGSYTAYLADAYSGQPLLVPGLTVTPEGPNSFAFELAPQLTVTLTPATDTPDAGANLTVAWAGAPASGGYIGVGPEDEAFEFSYQPAVGASGEVEAQLPATPGAYELRYFIDLPEGGSRVIGAALVSVQEVTASLEAPDTVTAGGLIEVAWTGPDNTDDYITIAAIGSDSDQALQWVPTNNGTPLTVTAPEVAGSYELRYVASPGENVLARREIVVAEATAAIRAPRSAKAGSVLLVEVLAWTGNPDDFITVVPVDYEEGYWDGWESVTEETVELIVTDVPGEYEIRYLTGAENLTLARSPLTLTAVTASVSGPAWVAAGQEFAVSWQGENMPWDLVVLVEIGADDDDFGTYSANTEYGNPLEFWAPDEPGQYELRYLTGQSYFKLASTPLEVR